MSYVNVDPLNPNDGSPDPMRLLQVNIRGVRLVIRDDDRIRQYTAIGKASGVAVLGAITEESHGYTMDDEPCDVYQIGNEPDRGSDTQPRVEGSDIMGASAYVDYWNLYYDTWFAEGKPLAGRPVIGAGLQSGRLSYWAAVLRHGGLRGASGMAIHPYGKTAAQAKTLIQAYQANLPAMPIWITEWHRPLAEVPAYVGMLHQTTGVVGDAFFCWHQYENWALGPERARLLGSCR